MILAAGASRRYASPKQLVVVDGRTLLEHAIDVLTARGERPVVAPAADGVLAPPILIERSHFHLAEGLAGDIGLRQILRANPELVRIVPVAAHPPDVDTPDDLARIGRP